MKRVNHFLHILSMVAAVCFAAGCGSSTMTTINQPAIWQVPANTKIALISVDAGKKVVERAPSDFSNFRALLHGALATAFGAHIEVIDRTDLGFRQVIAPVQKEAKKLWIFTEETAPALPEDQVWGAAPPAGLPNAVVEPMTLAVKVLGWSMNNQEVGSGKLAKNVPVAHFDLVYTLWTKQGKEIETVRVVSSADGEYNGAELRSLPARPWRLTGDYRGEGGVSGDRDKVFRAALGNTAKWYAWPMVPHEIKYQAVWHKNDDRDKEAIKLADAGKWDDAYAIWKGVADADPKAGPAQYNMGQVRYVQGNVTEALAHFTKACAIDDRMLYCSYRNSVAETMALSQKIGE